MRIGAELRFARMDRGLSLQLVADVLGTSPAQLSRIEHALAPRVPVAVVVEFATIVGLDLVIRTYPGPAALRDGAQVELLADFGARLHASLRWGVEVPLPIAGDQRAWDGMVAGTGWRYGVEVESLPRDAQALVRRLQLKERDGEVDGVLLVLPDTRRVRSFREAAAPELVRAFPILGPVALRKLQAGLDPGGSALILLPRHRPAMAPTPGKPGSGGRPLRPR